jgi:hypothetical protein
MTLFTRSCLLLALVTVASCGGGGGGDDDSGPPNPGPGAFAVSLDRTSVSFEFIQGAPPQAQTLNATWTGTPPAQIFIQALLAGQGLSQIIPIAIGQTSANITLTPIGGLDGGTYSGTVTFNVCSDSACNQRIGGTPIPVNFTVNVRTPVFTGPRVTGFIYTRGTTPAVTPRILNIAAAAGAWTASADQSWITLSKTSGNGADTLSVFFDPSNLASGQYGGFVTVTGASGTQRLQVTLDLTTPVISLTIPGGLPSLAFGGINGTPFAPMTLGVSIGALPPMPLSISSNVAWGTVSNVPATVSSSQQFTLTLNPAVGPLASGIQHAGTVRIVVGNGNFNAVQDFPLTLGLTAPTLTVSDAIVLGGPVGRDFDQIPASVSLNTGAGQFAWTVSGAPTWLDLDKTSGTASATPDQILLEPLRLQTTPGTSNAVLTFSAQVNGDTVTTNVPVSFNLDTHRLIASQTGVALVSTSDVSWRRLNRTVQIRDNLGLTTPWTATDDASWLSVTASGTSGGNLVLQANTAGLGNGLHLANVTIASTDTTVSGPERIRVGLWVTSGAPPASQTTISPDVFDIIEADPIRPYVYVHRTFPSQDQNTIRVYNVYTGAEDLPAITGISDKTNDITVSSDGSFLFAMDRDGTQQIRRVDLDTRMVDANYPAPRTEFSQTHDQIRYLRPNGVGILMNNGNHAYLASNGTDVGGGMFEYFDVTADGNDAYFSSLQMLLDYTSADGGKFVREPGGSAPVAINGFTSDAASTRDGSRVYVSAGTGNLITYNGQNMTARTSLPILGTNNVEIDVDGRLFAATFSAEPSNNNRNVWVFSPTDVELHNYALPQGIATRGLAISGDGYIAVIVGQAGNGQLYFIPVGP